MNRGRNGENKVVESEEGNFTYELCVNNLFTALFERAHQMLLLDAFESRHVGSSRVPIRRVELWNPDR